METSIYVDVENATAVLAGKKLWRCTRAADLAAFQFGERRTLTDFRGIPKEVGEYALHVQCAWHIAHLTGGVVVGSGDLYYPPNGQSQQERSAGFDWDRGPNRQDELLQLFFQDGTRDFTVEKVEIAAGFTLHIILNDSLSLNVFPNDSLDHEHWRLFIPGNERSHFVVNGKGVEQQ